MSSDNKDNNIPYLLLRESKIKRNQDRLEHLGLVKLNYSRPQKRKSQSLISSTPSRRSSRLIQQQGVEDTENQNSQPIHHTNSAIVVSYDNDEKSNELQRALKIKRNDEQLEQMGLVTQNTTKIRTGTSSQSSSSKSTILASRSGKSKYKKKEDPNNPSTRMVCIDIKSILFGLHNDNDEGDDLIIIGQELSSTGKAAVVQTCLERSYHDHSKTALKCKFNKYSGICEWKNDALLLWVNIGAGTDYSNQFLEEGRKMTWFGGSRMTEQSPVIHRLMEVAKKSNEFQKEEHNQIDSHDGIILWCRMKDPVKKGAFGPYICMGRVGYESHIELSYPLQFVFRLMDYSHIIKNRPNLFSELFLNS